MSEAAGKPAHSRLFMVSVACLGLFALLTLILQLTAGGPPPNVPRLTPLQRQYLLPFLFGVANLAPFYILARLAGGRTRGRTDHVIYLGGGAVIFVIAIVFRTYAYTLALSTMQLIFAGLVQLVAWMVRDRVRRPRAFAILGALAASFLVNWAVAPWAHMVDADDYYGPDMPRMSADNSNTSTASGRTRRSRTLPGRTCAARTPSGT